jgi:hypothetical protein
MRSGSTRSFRASAIHSTSPQFAAPENEGRLRPFPRSGNRPGVHAGLTGANEIVLFFFSVGGGPFTGLLDVRGFSPSSIGDDARTARNPVNGVDSRIAVSARPTRRERRAYYRCAERAMNGPASRDRVAGEARMRCSGAFAPCRSPLRGLLARGHCSFTTSSLRGLLAPGY